MCELTIITPVFNNIQDTKTFVTQVINTTKLNFKLIIINNGSTDGTEPYLEIFEKDKRFIIIKNKTNRGYSHANNQAIDVANSNYICFLNNDVLLYEGWDLDLVKPFSKDNRLGAIGPITNYCAGIQAEDYGLKDVTIENYKIKQTEIKEKNKSKYRTVDRIIGFCLMTKTSLMKDIRGFDEKYIIGNYEDDDLCIRIRLQGFKIVVSEEVFIYHKGQQTFVKNRITHHSLMVQNQKYFKEKWGFKFDSTNTNYYLDLNKCEKQYIVNKNYLLLIQSGGQYPQQNLSLKTKSQRKIQTPEVAKIGNLTNVFSAIKKKNHQLAFEHCVNSIKLRPFHPEAYLQLIEIVLDKQDFATAKQISDRLLKLTPNWDQARGIAKGLRNINIKGTKIKWPNLPEKRQKPKITVCLITKNEEDCLNTCLSSVKRIASQIVVLDTGSNDKTILIAKSHDAEVFEHKWNKDFSEARNKSLEYARGDWVLILDADEELSKEGREKILEEVNTPNVLGFRIPLENLGPNNRGVNYVPRLFRNAPGLHFIGRIHEQIHAAIIVLMENWGMVQKMGKTLILHHGYQKDIMERKGKIKRNLELYEDTIDELPNEPSILMNYAVDLSHDGQSQKANQTFREAFGILASYDSKFVISEVREQIIVLYGKFLVKEEKYTELIEVMSSSTAKDTGPTASIHYMYGIGLMNKGEFGKATIELQAAIEKADKPSLTAEIPELKTSKPLSLLAYCHAALGENSKADLLYNKTVEEFKHCADTFHNYAKFKHKQGNSKAAMEVLINGIRKGFNEQKIWELGCGIVNSDPELGELAQNWTEEALKFYPKSDVVNVRRGEALMKNGLFTEAIPHFERLSKRGDLMAKSARLICMQATQSTFSNKDIQDAQQLRPSIQGWLKVLKKAPCQLDENLMREWLD